MAFNRIKGITVEIDGNTTKLTKALESVNKSIKTTQTELKDVNKLLKLNPTSTELLKQKQKLLGEAISDTEKKLEQEKDALKQLQKAGDSTENQKAQEALQREIIETEAQLKSLKKQAQDSASVLGTQFKEAGKKVKEVGEQIKQTGEQISGAGENLTRSVTAPIVALGGLAVKETASFDKTMSKVQAISGATGDEFEILRDKAREMGATTKFSASESADAFVYMAMAGWDTQQMLEGIDGILALSASDGLDLATTSDIVTDALTAFGLQAEDAGHFADVLASASSSANTNVSMLGESFKYVAPVAGAMNYSIEDISVALGVFANNGIKGSQAGSALRNIIQRMASPTKEVSEAMEALGVNLEDGEGNAYSFMEVMQQLRQGFGDLKGLTGNQKQQLENLNSALEEGSITEEDYNAQLLELVESTGDATLAEKARQASMLGGARAMPALLALINTSDEEFQNLTESIYGASDAFDGLGQAKGMAEIMQDNLEGQLTKLKSALGEVAIQIGDLLMPYITQLVEKLQSLVDWFSNLDEGTKKTILTIAGIVAVVGPVLIIVGKLIAVIGTIISAIGTVIGWIGSFIGIIQTVVAVLGGPLTLAIGAVIAIGILLWKNWETVKAKAIELWNSLKMAFENIGKVISSTWESIKTVISNTWESIKSGISNAVSIISSTIANAFNGIKSTVSSIFEAIKNAITNPIETAKNMISNLIEGIKGLFNFSVSLPHIKLPHFSVSGSLNPLNWLEQGLPKVSVAWYKKAYQNPVMFTKPTVIPTMNGYKGFGDGAGAEVVMSLNKLQQMVGAGSGATVNVTVNGAVGQNVNELADIVVNKITKTINRNNGRW